MTSYIARKRSDLATRKAEFTELYKLMFPDYQDIVTVAQLQKMLGISRQLTYKLIGDGYIPGVKIGNAFRVPKANVINCVFSEDGRREVS